MVIASSLPGCCGRIKTKTLVTIASSCGRAHQVCSGQPRNPI